MSARIVLVGVGCGLLFAALVVAGTLEPLELGTYDRLFELRGSRPPTAPIVIVAIDESSFAELGTQWPFPRAMHGELLDRISAGRPLVIGIDLIFDTPSSRGPRDDEALGAAVARAGNVVLAAAPTVDVQAHYTRFDLNLPIPVIRAGAVAVAPANNLRDSDGHLRRGLTALRVGDQMPLGFGAAIHRIARGAGLPAAPMPREPSFLINFRGGPKTFPWLSYYQVLRGEVGPEAFRGKIVLIGATSEILHDIFATPFAPSGDMSGVEILANITETLLQGDHIREVPRLANAATTILVGLTIGILVARVPGAVVPAALILLALVASATYVCFAFLDTWFDPVGPGLALAASLVLSIVAAGGLPERTRFSRA